MLLNVSVCLCVTVSQSVSPLLQAKSSDVSDYFFFLTVVVLLCSHALVLPYTLSCTFSRSFFVNSLVVVVVVESNETAIDGWAFGNV